MEWSSHPFLRVPVRKFSPEEKRLVIEQILHHQRKHIDDCVEMRRSIRIDRKEEAALRTTRAILGRLSELVQQWRNRA